jgi:hypothetical protein
LATNSAPVSGHKGDGRGPHHPLCVLDCVTTLVVVTYTLPSRHLGPDERDCLCEEIGERHSASTSNEVLQSRHNTTAISSVNPHCSIIHLLISEHVGLKD